MRSCVVLVGAGVLVIGAQAASAQVIEICKSSANGMSGRDFSYTVAPSGGSAFSVGPIKGGRCSGPITVTGATATITEAAVRSGHRRQVGHGAAVGTQDCPRISPAASVTVTTGASTASETLVTFTNQPAGGNYGTLKVCKLTETPAFLGRRSRSASTAGRSCPRRQTTPSTIRPTTPCRILGTFQVGSVVHVHEQIPAGTEVQWIDTDPGENLRPVQHRHGRRRRDDHRRA